MRRLHFGALRPVCPVCQVAGRMAPLEVATVVAEEAGDIREGVLQCTWSECLHEYPILDGIPIVVPQLRRYVSDNAHEILGRRDLSRVLEGVIGDCCGPGSSFDVTRQHLSSYVWSHYADFDPEEGGGASSLGMVLDRALELAGPIASGLVLDVGCAVGRASCELASRLRSIVLGVDMRFPMLQTAVAVTREGHVRYPRRRVGIVYDRREFAVTIEQPDQVDFWACDAMALPFTSAQFALIVLLNVLDCVASPVELLTAAARLLRPGGKVILACPYDWSPVATAVEGWIGGHSQRGPDGGDSASLLRKLLTPGGHPSAIDGLRIVAEDASVTWRVRVHDRSVVEYRVHVVVAEAVGPERGAER